MESAKIPMRGRVKDAEAEALLRLLRREKEFHDRISAPQIQQRIPLPAIGCSTGTINRTQQTCERTNDPTFITQALEASRFLNSDNEAKELVSDTSFLWTPKSDVNCNLLPSPQKEIYVPPFTWKEERTQSQLSSYSKCERNRHGRTLPPLEIPASPSDLLERPSCPKPGSPKLWED